MGEVSYVERLAAKLLVACSREGGTVVNLAHRSWFWVAVELVRTEDVTLSFAGDGYGEGMT